MKEFSAIHMVLNEFLRLSDGLANRSFCQSDISKANSSLSEQLLKPF